jgi:hypothetical protein
MHILVSGQGAGVRSRALARDGRGKDGSGYGTSLQTLSTRSRDLVVTPHCSTRIEKNEKGSKEKYQKLIPPE